MRLTPRQAQVLGLLAQGHNNIEIARLLHCSPITVTSHVGTIYQKLEVSGLSEPRVLAACQAVRMGIA